MPMSPGATQVFNEGIIRSYHSWYGSSEDDRNQQVIWVGIEAADGTYAKAYSVYSEAAAFYAVYFAIFDEAPPADPEPPEFSGGGNGLLGPGAVEIEHLAFDPATQAELDAVDDRLEALESAGVGANAVSKAIFTVANQLIRSTGSGTYDAMTVAASTLVGRGTSGGLTALTVEQVKTLLGYSLASELTTEINSRTTAEAALDTRLDTLELHPADTTGVHGFADTSLVLRMTGSSGYLEIPERADDVVGSPTTGHRIWSFGGALKIKNQYGQITQINPGYEDLDTFVAGPFTLTTTASQKAVLTPVINHTYYMKGFCTYTADNVGDMYMNFTLPAGATLEWGQWGMYQAQASTSGSTGPGTWHQRTNTEIAIFGGEYDGATAQELHASFEGVLVMGATAGNVGLQFKMNSGSTIATVVKDIFLKLEQRD